ncbi:MAG: hypothetical protein OXC44_06390 [Proteobacteria bacterium]|nr:hypothetical protein [Pseudomonadota bacterium]
MIIQLTKQWIQKLSQIKSYWHYFRMGGAVLSMALVASCSDMSPSLDSSNIGSSSADATAADATALELDNADCVSAQLELCVAVDKLFKKHGRSYDYESHSSVKKHLDPLGEPCKSKTKDGLKKWAKAGGGIGDCSAALGLLDG